MNTKNTVLMGFAVLTAFQVFLVMTSGFAPFNTASLVFTLCVYLNTLLK